MPSNTDKPIILYFDHEPNEIEQNVQLPIDLQGSGHTHNGNISRQIHCQISQPFGLRLWTHQQYRCDCKLRGMVLGVPFSG